MKSKNFSRNESLTICEGISRSSSGTAGYREAWGGSNSWADGGRRVHMGDFPSSSEFDRRDALKLSLQSLRSSLELEMISSLTAADLAWYKSEVGRIFANFLPEDQT